jgi:hypothetical protein
MALTLTILDEFKKIYLVEVSVKMNALKPEEI